ncbi:MAG: hypothetical protein CME06_08080 [Gemmatimonadetes bacterium]|nr:hypothetical protein [Gemmatimonadota bacterium]
MRSTTTIMTLAALAFSASTATAYTFWGTKDGNGRMDCSANTGYQSGEYSAIERGAISWINVSCSSFQFRRDSPLLINRTVPRRDGSNHIIFGDADGALAVTWLMNNSSSRECDMILENNINWNNGPGPSGWNQYDLEGVACHEFGHFLGLGHSNTAAATMYYAIGSGDDSKRSLHSDDQNGVCALY